MTEDERKALGRARRLVFQNLANGVPVERVMADLRLSALEVDQARRFVAKKIADYLFVRRQPPIPADSLTAVRFHRRQLLVVLARLGDLDLSTDIIQLKNDDGSLTSFTLKLNTQALDHPEMIEGASQRMAEHRSTRADSYIP